MRIERIDTGAAAVLAPRPAPPAPAPPPAPPPPARPSLGEAAHEAFVDAALNLKRALGPIHHTDLSIDVDPHTHSMEIRVIDQNTGETVREIPPDALKRFAKAFDTYLGTLLDAEA